MLFQFPISSLLLRRDDTRLTDVTQPGGRPSRRYFPLYLLLPASVFYRRPGWTGRPDGRAVQAYGWQKRRDCMAYMPWMTSKVASDGKMPDNAPRTTTSVPLPCPRA